MRLGALAAWELEALHSAPAVTGRMRAVGHAHGAAWCVSSGRRDSCMLGNRSPDVQHNTLNDLRAGPISPTPRASLPSFPFLSLAASCRWT